MIGFYARIELFSVVTTEFVGLANNTFHKNISAGVGTFLNIQTNKKNWCFLQNLNLNNTQVKVTNSKYSHKLSLKHLHSLHLILIKCHTHFCRNGKESLQNIYDNNGDNEGDSALQTRTGDKNISQDSRSWFLIYYLLYISQKNQLTHWSLVAEIKDFFPVFIIEIHCKYF
jgi:hypothetical protein